LGWRAIIFACALAATLPLAIKGASCGQDFDFHLQSWLAVADQWRHGVLYPHWIEAANYGAGEPRLVFYPPFSWMLGAFLGTIMPWKAAHAAFTLIVLTACGFSMNKLAGRWLPPNAAALAACAYILNPYALFVAYERTAYGELAAGIWLPLIVLYTLRSTQHTHTAVIPNAANNHNSVILNPAKDHNAVILSEAKDLWFAPAFTKPLSTTIPLALSIAAIWLTNAPAAVMASYTVAAITLGIAVRRRRWKAVLPVAASFAIGLGLTGFYLVPAAYERRWVDIARAIGPGMRFSDSFLFEGTGQSYHDQVLRTASWIFIAMLFAIAVSGWIVWKRRALRRMLLPLFASATVLLALQLPLSSLLWELAPELQFLQFPWRWSLVLSIVLAISLGLAVRTPAGSQRMNSFALQICLTLTAAIAMVAIATHIFWQFCDDEDAISAQLALFHSGAGFEGTDEYTATGADNSLIQQGLPAVRVLRNPRAETAQPVESSAADQENPTYAASAQDQLPANLSVEIWRPETKSFTVTAQTPAYAVLRLMDWPAWRVRVNGTVIDSRPHREDGLMAIPVRTGATRIEIAYRATPDVILGRGLSVVSLFALLTLAAASRKRRTVS
jgi:hypothetical protein